MRSDLKILWVDDTEYFFYESKEYLVNSLEDEEITLDFDYFNDVDDVIKIIERDSAGFKMYDILFIDFTLSNEVNGNELIQKLRDINVDADILFYSSNMEKEIRKIVESDIDKFEGVYISSRENFEIKAKRLIDKNIRKQINITNIRGFLMDQTSENDFTMNSYVIKYFDILSPECKEHIKNMVVTNIANTKEKFNTKTDELIGSLQDKGITNIRKILRMHSDVVPVSLKYEIFKIVVEFRNEDVFQEVSIDTYFKKIVSARNALAHKKLDICKQQKFLLYYDDFAQLSDRRCPDTCDEHSDEYKYSLKQWDNIRKMTKQFGKSIDLLQEKLFSNE